MSKFLLILHENPSTFAPMSPSEMQAVIAEYGAWAQKMGGMGRLMGGHKLMDEGGRRLSATGGRLVVTDGPYAEAKDVIGGFFIIEAADYAEAERLSADCPHVKYGEVELRMVHDI